MARLITAEEVLVALMESLVNPALAKVRPFGGANSAERDISNQMEAVAWLYNHYLCQELPNLEALDWEELCNKATIRQTRLSKFIGTSGVVGSWPLTLTEQKVKNACEAAKALRASSDSRGSSFITKVCVCLLNFRQDKCVLAFGATTAGMWSFIEKNKPLQSIKDNSVGAMLSDEECAFQAVEEQTGIKANVLQLEGSFWINDDLNEAGGSTKFYIMLCSGTFDLSPKIKLERVTWVPLDTVFSKAHDPLIDTLVSTVRSTPAVQYYHLRPFCSSLESWLKRQHEVKDIRHLTQALENRAGTLLEKVGGATEVKSYKEVEDDEEQIKLLSVNVGAAGLCTHLSIDGSAQSTTGLEGKPGTLISSTGCKKDSTSVQEEEEDKQRHTNLKVNAIVLETQLSTGSPQSSIIFRNRTEPSALRNGGSANDLDALSNRQVEDKARQVNEAVNALALSLNVEAPNGSPQSSIRKRKREEEHILDKAAAFLSLKQAYRSVRKRRKVLAKQLREHTLQADELYKQIAGCDTDLATLMGGGKAALQLAKEVCKECEKQTSSSDVSIDCSQADAWVKTDKVETSNKKRCFHMLKSSMQELNEVCTKNEWPLPSYGVFMHTNNLGENLYRGKVRIRKAEFELSETGEESDTAKNAKLSAAAYMLSTLHLLRARNGTI